MTYPLALIYKVAFIYLPKRKSSTPAAIKNMKFQRTSKYHLCICKMSLFGSFHVKDTMCILQIYKPQEKVFEVSSWFYQATLY